MRFMQAGAPLFSALVLAVFMAVAIPVAMAVAVFVSTLKNGCFVCTRSELLKNIASRVGGSAPFLASGAKCVRPARI